MFPAIIVGGPCSLHLFDPFPGKQSSGNLSARRSPLAAARSRLASRRRRIPTPATPRRRARCHLHEARAGIVAFISCCHARLSNGGLGHPGEIVSLPACTQRSIRSGAALASRLDALVFSGDGRGRCKALFYALSIFHATQRIGPTDKIPPRQPPRTSSPLASVLHSRCNCTIA